MKSKEFDVSEFLESSNEENNTEHEEQEFSDDIELEIQKKVVQEFAVEKLQLHEEIENARLQNASIASQVEVKNAEIYSLKSELERLRSTVSALEAQLAAQAAKELDVQERNPNALALLDRDVDLKDRFPGESRDFALEAIKEARDKAEAEGRIRYSQVLEGILVYNEKNGTLDKKRQELKEIFSANGNVINGNVIEELQKRGISHKLGDKYLLVDEIIKRNY